MATKLHNLLPLHHVASTDDLRPALTNIFIDGIYAVATDAHALVIQDLSDEFSKEQLELLNGKFIPYKAWEFMYKHCALTEEIEIFEKSLSFRTVLPNGRMTIYFADLNEQKFPNWRAVIPIDTDKYEPIEGFGITPKIYDRLTKALELEKQMTQFIFSNRTGAAIIKNIEVKAFGIIMPATYPDFDAHKEVSQLRLAFDLSTNRAQALNS